VLVPTKDRPDQIKSLLQSLADQEEQAGRIIIVASGQDINQTVNEFSGTLPIDYVHTLETGQIRQRNIGIRKLDARTPLVASIDDDIVFDPWAIKEIVRFWNHAPADTAGVGFNIVNGPSSRSSKLAKLLLLNHPEPGRVLISGVTTPISNLHHDIRSQWLNGGSTVWRQDILVNHPHKEINTKWAIGEDLIFSYPIGKEYPLFVCSRATVVHNHNPYSSEDPKWHFFHGRTQTLWVYNFVDSNKELSKTLFFTTLFFRLLAKSIYGLIAKRPYLVGFSLGGGAALLKIVRHEFSSAHRGDIREK